MGVSLDDFSPHLFLQDEEQTHFFFFMYLLFWWLGWKSSTVSFGAVYGEKKEHLCLKHPG